LELILGGIPLWLALGLAGVSFRRKPHLVNLVPFRAGTTGPGGRA